MRSIIARPGQNAHANSGQAARQRADRLAMATADQMAMALAYLSMIDPEAFDIAVNAVTASEEEIPGPVEAVPVCRRCGGLVGIFLNRGLQWQHYRGDGVTSGAQEIYDPGHEAEVER